ncbi:hypothetical protein [Pelagibaculum spongiae]|uniref:Uncharacterized protein n=1 Tax=Pelagibaculum spongiae TaxID=2080658 RepID=A0A2V1H357_9GAMM|nr:hypothetical protein [Pelagibaculum spongiae]PVZ69737.1 hypothetical protein DC094_10580 [Pelagibaculum spongiae]
MLKIKAMRAASLLLSAGLLASCGTNSFESEALAIDRVNLPDSSSIDPFLYDVFSTPLFHNGIFYLPNDAENVVFGFNGIPTENNPTPSFVLDNTELSSVQTIRNNSSQFFLTSRSSNNRDIIVYNAKLTIDNLSPEYYSLTIPSCSNGTQRFVGDISVTEDHLLAADQNSNRIIIWNLPITQNQQPANMVLGQSNLNNCQENDDDQNDIADSTPSQRTLSNPTSVWSDGNRIAVLDSNNNRALIWNSFPVSSFQPADLVLGQSNFTNSAANDADQDGISDLTTNLSTFNINKHNVAHSSRLHSDGSQLCLTDRFNNRVLLWEQFPTNIMQTADIEITQSRIPFSGPVACSFVENKLIINDLGNERWLIFDITSQQ